jgi:hypothetical protein
MHNLNYRQRRFVQAVQNGRSYAQAAREAGYAESMANVAGRKLAKHPAIAAELQSIRERQESLARLKPHEETALRLEGIDPDARDILELIIRYLAEKNVIQARLSIWSLQEFCKGAGK